MPSEYVAVCNDDGILRVTLNRPDKLNPLSSEIVYALQEAVAEAASDAVRVVLLTGSGRAFSAGADLRSSVTGSDVGDVLARTYNPLVAAMRALPKPIVAAVNGICAGAACNVALACDIVLAARSAVFIEVFARIGLLPDAGGTYLLPRAIGTPRAVAASMLAADIPAERALAWGMVWDVVDDATLAPAADALARRLAAGPTRAYAASKAAIYGADESAFRAALDTEARLQRGLGQSADFAEGVAAFLEKRPAAFTGT